MFYYLIHNTTTTLLDMYKASSSFGIRPFRSQSSMVIKDRDT